MFMPLHQHSSCLCWSTIVTQSQCVKDMYMDNIHFEVFFNCCRNSCTQWQTFVVLCMCMFVSTYLKAVTEIYAPHGMYFQLCVCVYGCMYMPLMHWR